MRHFGSLLVAAVFAPSIFLLTGTGLSAFNSALDDNKLYDPLGSLAALGALLLAGVLYGILVMARLSPLGPGLAGLASWAISGWALFDIEAYQRFFSLLDVHMGGAVGDTGLGIVLGIPLVATLFSGRRWRRSELYSPQAMPMRAQPEPPEPPELPDSPPPSLHYPVAAAFQAPRTPPHIPPTPEPDTLPTGLAPHSPIARPVSSPPGSGPSEPEAGGPSGAEAESRSAVPASTAATPLEDLPSIESMVEKLASWSSSSSARDSEPPTPIVMATSSDALPRRVPSPPAGGRDMTVPIVSPPPAPDNEVTERLGTPGSSVPQTKEGAAGN